MRKLASIQRVKTVDNILHPADGSETTLARITFEDIAWQCVAKRGEFDVGCKTSVYFAPFACYNNGRQGKLSKGRGKWTRTSQLVQA